MNDVHALVSTLQTELANLGEGRTVERVRAFLSEYFDLTETA